MAHSTPVASDVADIKRGECEGCTITASSHNPKDNVGALRKSGFSRSARSHKKVVQMVLPAGFSEKRESAERYRNGVETGV